MFDIKITINGKPATKSNISDTLERAFFNSVTEQIKEKVRKSITATEASQVKIDVKGNNPKNLEINISGPDAIVAKIKAALA